MSKIWMDSTRGGSRYGRVEGYNGGMRAIPNRKKIIQIHQWAIERIANGAHLSPANGAGKVMLLADLHGVYGEWGTADVLGYPDWQPEKWTGKADNDVYGIMVRSTTYTTGKLIIHKTDDPNRVYVLAVVTDRFVDVVGWIRGKEAQVPRFWKEDWRGKMEYIVPQSALRPMETCPRPQLQVG